MRQLRLLIAASFSEEPGAKAEVPSRKRNGYQRRKGGSQTSQEWVHLPRKMVSSRSSKIRQLGQLLTTWVPWGKAVRLSET